MLVGAAIAPSAPLLVPGVSERRPDELDEVTAAVHAELGALPDHDLLVVLTGAWGTATPGVTTVTRADLTALARPDLGVALPTAPTAAALVAEATGLAVADTPPVDAMALTLLVADARADGMAPTVQVALPAGDGADLVATGRRLAAVLPSQPGVAVVAAGDLAAGHTVKAPRHLVDGCDRWDAALARGVAAGEWAAVEALGPDEAQRVGARAWPALVVLGGLLEAAGVAGGLEVRFAGAPRGVGYLVAGT